MVAQQSTAAGGGNALALFLMVWGVMAVVFGGGLAFDNRGVARQTFRLNGRPWQPKSPRDIKIVRMFGGAFALIGAGVLVQGALMLEPSSGVEWQKLPHIGLPTCVVTTSLVVIGVILQWRTNPSPLRTAWSAGVVQRVALVAAAVSPPLFVVCWWALGPGPLSVVPGLVAVAASLVLFLGRKRPDVHDDPLGDLGPL
ncbi:hypothetical protein [Streptomyces cyslabdanicus]|uniref:hypothetical protein n=1 Tax=Streptomyces cyslabdanicus TaxID=1470456 RepID=UPI0040449570